MGVGAQIHLWFMFSPLLALPLGSVMRTEADTEAWLFLANHAGRLVSGLSSWALSHMPRLFTGSRLLTHSLLPGHYPLSLLTAASSVLRVEGMCRDATAIVIVVPASELPRAPLISSH